VLEELPDPSFVEGTAKLSERFAIALPDGDLGTLDDPMFVEWLLEHGEVAPFGDKGETKLDASVRNAKRLRARGAASITGFDVAGVLPAIEAALSPRCHLEAQLEDVIVYTTGGKFARHKDTPRTAALVGTLVVGLPIEHRGGAFTITDGGKAHAIDWSGVPTPDTVRWVALFSDVDHEIDEVTSGARVTLVYSLSRSARPRTDATREARLARLKAEVSKLQLTDDLLIACTRHIVTDGTQPQSIDTLRGTDREIADVFVEAGFQVAVRACIAGGGDNDVEGAMDDIQDLYGVARLAKAIPASVIADMDSAVSFTDEIDMEEYAEDGVEPGGVTLGGYIHDHTDLANWVIRPRARATAIYEGMYSETGYFGNEASYGHIYALAAIEVTRRP
jgi:hypothetical protein